jgi:hypothetical protein
MENKRSMQLRTMPYEEYLQTEEWQEKREQALERDGHCCRACNSGEKLEVHHRTYARRGNEDLGDLTTFCDQCHKHFHERMDQSDMMAQTHSAPFVLQENATQKWEEYLIGMFIQNPHLISFVCVIFSENDFHGADTRSLYQLLHTTQQRTESQDDPTFDQLVPSNLMSVVSRCRKAAEPEAAIDEMTQTKTAMQIAARIRRKHILQERQERAKLMQSVYEAGDAAEVRRLAIQIRNLDSQLRAIDVALQPGM